MRFPQRKRWLIGGGLFAALIAAIGTLALAEALRYAAAPTQIVIEASPIAAFDGREPGKTRFGRLEFRGGLALTSKFEAFGGVSGLHMEPDGEHFLAVTDNGSWLRGRIVYRDDRPVGIADAEMAPMLGADGKALAARGWYDVESIAKMGGHVYVGIERAEQIVRFDMARDGMQTRGEAMAVPSDFKSFRHNKSLECLAAAPAGAPHGGKLIVITEETLDAQGNMRSFVLGPEGASDKVERFSVKRSDDFDISDCTILPPGDLLLLERRYTPTTGVAMRIRRVPLSAIKEGALVDGAALIEADLAYQIDNMEGIAVHKNARGETVLTLVSDDNFSVIQRNLLLQFVLVGE